MDLSARAKDRRIEKKRLVGGGRVGCLDATTSEPTFHDVVGGAPDAGISPLEDGRRLSTDADGVCRRREQVGVYLLPQLKRQVEESSHSAASVALGQGIDYGRGGDSSGRWQW